jgi:hypothetical protein
MLPTEPPSLSQLFSGGSNASEQERFGSLVRQFGVRWEYPGGGGTLSVTLGGISADGEARSVVLWGGHTAARVGQVRGIQYGPRAGHDGVVQVSIEDAGRSFILNRVLLGSPPMENVSA